MLALSLVLIFLVLFLSTLTLLFDGDLSILCFTGFGATLGLLIMDMGALIIGIMHVAIFSGLGVFLYFYRRWEI